MRPALTRPPLYQRSAILKPQTVKICPIPAPFLHFPSRNVAEYATDASGPRIGPAESWIQPMPEGHTAPRREDPARTLRYVLTALAAGLIASTVVAKPRPGPWAPVRHPDRQQTIAPVHVQQPIHYPRSARMTGVHTEQRPADRLLREFRVELRVADLAPPDGRMKLVCPAAPSLTRFAAPPKLSMETGRRSAQTGRRP